MERVDLGPCQADVDRRAARSRVIILPGARYSTQAPLLWFAREAALSCGAGAMALRTEMPADGDPFAWACDRALRALEFESIEHRVVIGKSIASAAAGLVAERKLAAVWITPLLARPASPNSMSFSQNVVCRSRRWRVRSSVRPGSRPRTGH